MIHITEPGDSIDSLHRYDKREPTVLRETHRGRERLRSCAGAFAFVLRGTTIGKAAGEQSNPMERGLGARRSRTERRRFDRRLL